MIVSRTSGRLRALLLRRYGNEPHTTVEDDGSEKERWRLFSQMRVIPAIDTPSPVLLLSSLGRRPHVREISGESVIVDDLLLGKTLASLEAFHIYGDRALVPWTYLNLVTAELLLVSGLANARSFALYISDRCMREIAPLKDSNGIFRRPMRASPEIVAAVTKAERVIAVFPLLHELGHTRFRTDATWRRKAAALKAAVNPLYYATPTVFDDRYGLLSNNAAGDKTLQDDRDAHLRGSLVEEVSCDIFALVNFLLYPPVDLDAPTVMLPFRLFLWTDLLDELRKQVGMRLANKLRFRTVMKTIQLRFHALMRLLGDRGAMLRALFGVRAVRNLEERLALLPLDEILTDLGHCLDAVGLMYTEALGRPTSFEREFDVFDPIGMARSVKPDPDEPTLPEDFFGPRVLSSVRGEGLAFDSVAPHIQTACHLMLAHRQWTHEWHADGKLRKKYRTRVAAMTDEEILTIASEPNNQVRNSANLFVRAHLGIGQQGWKALMSDAERTSTKSTSKSTRSAHASRGRR